MATAYPTASLGASFSIPDAVPPSDIQTYDPAFSARKKRGGLCAAPRWLSSALSDALPSLPHLPRRVGEESRVVRKNPELKSHVACVREFDFPSTYTPFKPEGLSGLGHGG